MTTLTDFLLARIAEDEAVARAATAGPWRYEVASNPQDTGHYHGAVMAREHHMPELDATSYEAVVDGYTSDLPYGGGQEFEPTTLYVENGEHIARHDPARVLAECEAKRRIVGLHVSTHGGGSVAYCVCCGVGEQGRGFTDFPHATEEDCYDRTHTHYPCATLRALALPYAGHPDYREEWKP